MNKKMGGKTIVFSVILSISIFLFFIFKGRFFSIKLPKTTHNNLTNNITTTLFVSKKKEFSPQIPILGQIFSDDHSWVATLSAERIRVLLATGDVIPARSVNYQSTKLGNFKWAFGKTAEILKTADITLINLESPLIANCPLTNEGMKFCGDLKHVEGLLYAGVDIASLANNHLGDYGEEGIESTINLLKTANVLFTGISGPAFKEVGGVRFAFLGYDDINRQEKIISSAKEDKIKEDVGRAKMEADIVVVSFHWGVEYTEQSTKRQQDLAHLAVDSGADLIIGNHPHWIQPIEIYKDKLIVYAHGNFIFDQMWSEKTREGIVGRYIFYDKQLIDIQFLPVFIEDYGQPDFLLGKRQKQILETLKEASIKLLENESF